MQNGMKSTILKKHFIEDLVVKKVMAGNTYMLQKMQIMRNFMSKRDIK
jgi:hypothetical protein